MKTIKLRSGLVAISFAFAASLGICAQANADTIAVPVSLNGDVVKFVETNTGCALDAAGNILDTSGNIVGVVYGPDGKVVHEVTGDKIVVIKERGDSIAAASLYNRLVDLQNLLIAEKALNHISGDKFDALSAELTTARSDLDAKVASGSVLSFQESLDVGASLDAIASRVRGELNNVAVAEVVFKPMVIVSNPEKKRIAIYQRTVKSSDGITKTTQTTTTETKTE